MGRKKIALSMQQRQKQELVMTQAMQKAMQILQMPTLELAAWLKNEINQNPLLEDLSSSSDKEKEAKATDMEDFAHFYEMDESFQKGVYSSQNEWQAEKEEKKHKYRQSLATTQCSLYEHLMQQLRCHLADPNELKCAEYLIGLLDSKGFIPLPLSEIAEQAPFSLDTLEIALKRIQTLDPVGLGALDAQESLLIQLKEQKKEGSLAFKLLKHHYMDLLQNRWPYLQKKYQVTSLQIEEAIQHDIAHLAPFPGLQFTESFEPPIFPDVILLKVQKKWKIKLHKSALPRFRLSEAYMSYQHDKKLPLSERQTVKGFVASAKWLEKVLKQREKLIEEITAIIVHTHESFFHEESSKLAPLSVHEVAEQIQVSPSTIHRAIRDKYLSYQGRLFSFKSFFTSNSSAKELLQQLVQNEDKKAPLSDTKLSELLNSRGVPCARRTIAKYRKELRIGAAAQRKKWG